MTKKDTTKFFSIGNIVRTARNISSFRKGMELKLLAYNSEKFVVQDKNNPDNFDIIEGNIYELLELWDE